MTVTGVNRVQAFLYLFVQSLPKIVSGEFKARLDEAPILFDSEAGILVFVVEDPAFAFGDNVVAEFLSC